MFVFFITSHNCQPLLSYAIRDTLNRLNEEINRAMFPLPPLSVTIFLKAMLRSSGLLPVTTIGDIWKAWELHSKDIKLYKEKYQCDVEGISQFFKDSYKLKKSFREQFEISEHPMNECIKLREDFESYKRSYNKFLKFKKDMRTPEKIARDFHIRYSRIMNTWKRTMKSTTCSTSPKMNSLNLMDQVLWRQ